MRIAGPRNHQAGTAAVREVSRTPCSLPEGPPRRNSYPVVCWQKWRGEVQADEQCKRQTPVLGAVIQSKAGSRTLPTFALLIPAYTLRRRPPSDRRTLSI